MGACPAIFFDGSTSPGTKGEGGDVTEPVGDVDPTPAGEGDASQEG